MLEFIKQFGAMRQPALGARNTRLPTAREKELLVHWVRIRRYDRKNGTKLLHREGGVKHGKLSRMMQICMTPSIRAPSKVNNFALAEFFLELIPDAITLVRTGVGSFVMYDGKCACVCGCGG
jgi:hypothetical protein